MRNPTYNLQPATRNQLVRWLWLVIVAAQLTAAAADSVWQRVVVIGASASGGFVLSEPFGGTNTRNCKLNYYLDAAITPPHAPLKNLATAMLFLSPEAIATQEIEAVTNTKPTLVIGVDFLFWFCYGEGRTDAARAQRFESGLKLLERISCPLVIGDIPDASAATNSGIISVEQVPSETARAAANQRLRAWAKTRPHVSVVPLAQFMHAVMTDGAIKIHRVTIPAGKTRAFLQDDQLHPNPRGAAVLSLGILDAFMAANPKIPAGDVRWKVADVYRRGYALAQPVKPVVKSVEIH